MAMIKVILLFSATSSLVGFRGRLISQGLLVRLSLAMRTGALLCGRRKRSFLVSGRLSALACLCGHSLCCLVLGEEE